MRLRRLHLECYGNFENATLDLTDQPGQINLIVAPNGAGKSVLRQAMAELLFGIHPQTPMGFQFDYARMRLRATAVFPGGEAYDFTRRKGRANTLTDPSGQPIAILPDRLPREADRKRLERLFVLDSAQLRAGGKALLQSDGDLADALLSSAGDLGSARALAADLAARRDAAAPKRRIAATPFYQAFDAWTAAGARLDKTVVKPPIVAEQERLRTDALQDRQTANAQAAAAAATLARLARVRSTRRHLEALDAAEAWLAAHPGAPQFAPAIGLALASAKQAVEAAAQRAATAQQQHAALAADLAAAPVDDPALTEAAAIERLAAERARSEQSLADIPKRQAELTEAKSAIARLLRELASPVDPADAAAELRSAADIAAARALIAQAADLAAARTAAATAAARARDALAEAEDDLAALPAALQTDALRAAVAEAVADGEPARQASQARSRAAEAAAALAAAVARVPFWQGDAAALIALPIAPEPTWTRLDAAATAAHAAAATAEARRADDAAALTAARDRLAALTQAGPLPDEAALAAARAHRDRGWTLLYRRIAGSPDADAEAAYLPGTPLPLAFERAMAAADAIADRRLAETERLAAAAELQSTIARAQSALDASTARASAAAAAATASASAWSQATAALSLPPTAGLAELRTLLAARDAVLSAAAAQRSADAAASALADRQSAWATGIASLMQTAPDTLPRLIAAAQHQLAEADRIAAQRQALTRTRIAARRAVDKATPALADAEAAMATWTQDWDAVLLRLRRPGGEAPAITAAVLDRLVALPAKVAAAETATLRLAEMHDQLDRFATAAAALADRLAEAPAEPAALADRLTARLTAARAAHAARDERARQTAAALDRHRRAATALADAGRTLLTAIRATGADTLEQAEHRVALAAEHTQHAAASATARQQLRDDGEGLDLATLRAEADAIPQSAMPDAMREAEQQAQQAQSAAQDAAARAERAEGDLRRLAAAEDASRAAADRQAAAAQLSRVLEDALVQHLAATMLDHALQQVEASGSANQRLARIGATFARLTGGAYDRLSPAEEDSESKEHGRLIAHEAGGAEKHIARLSEGTRDQLYLALRLIAVEDYALVAPPLPFIADDILQTFDDTRARAALEALVSLSHHAQVIILTHHPHLLPLSQGLPTHIQRL
jgi:uncharacterized protein YhaN